MSIHTAIKARRERLGWTQKQLAEKVSEIEGLPPEKTLAFQTVQQWEREKGTAPKRSRLSAVAQALGTSVDALMSGHCIDPPKMRELDPEEASFVAELRFLKSLSGPAYRRAVDTIRALANSLRQTEALLRIDDTKGFVTEVELLGPRARREALALVPQFEQFERLRPPGAD